MTGYPQFNYPAFNAAARTLRSMGYEIINPVDLEPPAVRDAALASPDGQLVEGNQVGGETWGAILGRDVAVVADEVDGIVFLPSWYNSRGAVLEATTGLLTGKKFYMYSGRCSPPVLPAQRVADLVRAHLRGAE